jgi:methionyl-tRNA formyltransferase
LLERRVRAFNPFPICFSVLGGERIRVWQASSPQPSANPTAAPGTIVHPDDAGIVVSCGECTLSLEVLQLEGGRALSAQELLRAHQAKFAPGRCFDLPSASAG